MVVRERGERSGGEIEVRGVVVRERGERSGGERKR